MENKRIKLTTGSMFENNSFFYNLHLMHSLEVIFSFFIQEEIIPLRLVCKLFNEIFKETWSQHNIIKIYKHIGHDLYEIPFFKKIDVSNYRYITNKQLSYLKGVHTMIMDRCFNFTNQGLLNLTGIHTIDLSCCHQITDKGLSYLTSVNTINLSYCFRITNEGLSYLNQAHRISVIGCSKITKDVILQLEKIHSFKCYKFSFLRD